MINDQNFKFLENYKDITNYQEIIERINSFKDCISSGDWSKIMLLIRQILELYFDHIFFILKIQKTENSLGKMVGLIKDKISKNSRIYSDLNYLKDNCNSYVHANDNNLNLNYETDSYVVIHSLFQLCEIMYYFKDEKLDLTTFKFSKEEYIQVNNSLEISSVTKNNYLDDPIKAELIAIEDIFKNLNGRILIPMYQRNYVWTLENVDVLIEDIKDNLKETNKNHYLGTIATKKIERDGEKLVKIIDGQQRITTALLIIVVIRDILYLKTKEEIEYYEFIYEPTFESYMNTLIFDYEDRKIFQELIRFDQNKIREKKEYFENKPIKKEHLAIKNMVNNYLHIYDQFINLSPDNLKEIFNNFTRNFNITLISFNENVYKNKDEMKIFDNINSKGSMLKLSDLIKNYILSLCDNKILENPSESQLITQEYNKYFPDDSSTIDKFFESIGEYYNCEQLSNNQFNKLRLIKEAIDKILSKYLNISNKENLDIDQYKHFLKKLSEYYEIFCYLVKPNKSEKIPSILKNFGLDKILFIVKFTEWNKSILYYIYLIYECFGNDKINNQSTINKCAKETLLALIKYLIVRQLKRNQGDSTIKIDVLEFYSKLKSNEFLLNNNSPLEKMQFIKDETLQQFMITNDLYNKLKEALLLPIESNEIKKSILLLADFYLSNCLDSNMILPHGEKNSELEHIMPKDKTEWEKNWNYEYPDLSKEDLIAEHDKYVDLLGNCLVIPKELNSKMKNKTFNTKKDILHSNNFSSNLYNPSIKEITFGIVDCKSWGFEEIKKRTDDIQKYIVNKIITKGN